VAGRPDRRPRRSHLDAVLTEQYLRRQYVEERRSAAWVAEEVGCSHKTVLRYLARHGLPVRGRGQRGPKYAELGSPGFLRSRYIGERATMSAIAAEVGCSRASVSVALAAAGIRPFGANGSRRLSAAFLRVAYVGEGRSTVDLAAELGCGPSTIARALRRHGIAVRPRGGYRRPAVRQGTHSADSASYG
jgi:DNA-binding CsgD family transcriptional regulator